MIELIYELFVFPLLPKLLSLSRASFNNCAWRNLITTFFFAHNYNTHIIKPGILNGFEIEFDIL